MKTIKIFAAIVVMALSLVGCSEDFFDAKPTETITPGDLTDVVDKNPDMVNGLMGGLYKTLFTAYTGGTESHQDFGQKSVDINTDLLCGDMVCRTKSAGFFYNAEELTVATRTNNTTYRLWRYYFRLVKASNDILLLYKDDVNIPEKGASNWGQAKAVRAYCYYNLAMLFSKGYVADPDFKCAPIYNIKNMEAAQPKATVKEMLEFAKTDLEAATKALKGVSHGALKSSVDESVANGLLAYVYLTLGMNDEAIYCAENAISLSGNPMTSSDMLAGFNNVNTPGWMWGVDITDANTSQLATFWGHIDMYTYSYATVDFKAIDKSLFDAIDKNDIRKKQFLTEDDAVSDEEAAFILSPYKKFYDAARVVDGDKKWENDIFWMRVSEMYLIKAEALAQKGDASFITPLNTLLALRDNGSVPVYDMTDPLAAVYLQWRIEFWGEGKSYFAMKRMKRSITRGENHPEHDGSTISWDDDRLTFPTPESEAINNPNFES